MDTPDFTTFADTGDFCRLCDGVGTIPEDTPRGTTLHEPCDQCGGHGFRTLRSTPVSEAA